MNSFLEEYLNNYSRVDKMLTAHNNGCWCINKVTDQHVNGAGEHINGFTKTSTPFFTLEI